MLQIDENGLTTAQGTSIQWNEVVAVHATKIDAITHSVTMLTLDHECGEFIEIPTDSDGFTAIRDQLADFLPLPTDWYHKLETLPNREGITLMQR